MLTEGIHPNVPMSDYIADPCPEPSLSTTVCQNLIERSPAHAKAEHVRLGNKPRGSSRPADRGSAAHSLLSGGDQSIAWIDAPDFRTKAAREAKQAAYDAGQVPMLEKERWVLGQMRCIAVDTLERHNLLGAHEQTVLWTEPNGVWCRSRPDIVCNFPKNMVVDYKTTQNADPSTWIRRTLFAMGDDIQAALCLRGLAKLEGKKRDWVWLVQEVDPPFACSLVGMMHGGEMFDIATRKVERAVELFGRCLETGQWPGYTDQIAWAEPPSWVQWDAEERLGVQQ